MTVNVKGYLPVIITIDQIWATICDGMKLSWSKGDLHIKLVIDNNHAL